MFLPYDEPIVKQALYEAVLNLNPLLSSLEDMELHGSLHELSCIISDPGIVSMDVLRTRADHFTKQ